MICLVNALETPVVGIPTRVRRALRGYSGLTAGETVILGMRALILTMDIPPNLPLKVIRKRIGYAAQSMRASRAGKVLFAKNFPYREMLLREGFDEIDGGHLTELLMGKIVSHFSGQDKIAAFYARHLTGEAERVFCQICRDFKYVMAAVEGDSGRLYDLLSRRLGISVIGQPTEKQLLKADVAVFFSPPDCRIVLADKCVAIPVSNAALNGVICRKAVSGLTVALKDGWIADIPDGFAREPLIAAALDAGTLHRNDVLIDTLEIRDMYA